MTRAFFFLLSHSLKNRVIQRLMRLRAPKYLISAIAGLAYFYYVVFHYFIGRPQGPRGQLTFNDASLAAAEILFAGILLFVAIYSWFSAKLATSIFTESDIQILFPAPIHRTSLIHYRIAKAQTGILFGTLLSFVIIGRTSGFPKAAFLLIALYFIYSFLFLYRMAIALEARRKRLRTWVLGGCLLFISSVMIWTRWFPPPGPILTDPVGWLQAVTGSGPAYYLLFPFRMMVRPALSLTWPQFIWRLLPLLAMNGIIYFWIRNNNAVWEMAVLGSMEKTSGKGAPSKASDKAKPRGNRLSPFFLSPEGFAPVALYWKNLILAGVVSIRWLLPAWILLALMVIMIAKAAGTHIAIAAGSVAAAMAVFLTALGPILFRHDLRTDLKNVDVLKTYPIPGWGIVLGEILTPWSILAVLEGTGVLLATFLLTETDGGAMGLHDRILYGLGALLVLPCLSCIGVLIQNATVLILPGWVHLGKEHTQGIEAMGQRLISSFATVLFLLIAVLPSAIPFLIIFFGGYAKLGTTIVPVAACAAAMVLLVEAGVGVRWLGKLFEKFDPSA